MQRTKSWLAALGLGMAIIVGWQVLSSGQQPAGEKGKEASNRLEFEIVHSFDGKYLGDTPGHMGRIGGLTNRRPRIALGDYVYRGEEKIGSVTNLEWNRTNNSLDIEFDPEPKIRIFIGDTVSIPIDTGAAAKSRQP